MLTETRVQQLIDAAVAKALTNAKTNTAARDSRRQWQSESYANMLVLTHDHSISDVDGLNDAMVAKLPWIGKKKVANLPAAPDGGLKGTMAFVPDEAGGAVMAFWDGDVWRRVTDRAIVS